MATLLDAHIIEDALKNLPDWSGDQQRLTRTAKLTDEQDAEVREHLTIVADAMDHHPEVERTGQETRFTVSTHSAGGVTSLDIPLASQIDSLVRRATGQAPPPPPAEMMPTQVVTHAADEGQEGTSTAGEGKPAEEFMGVPSGAQGTPQVPLPDTAPGEPEPGKPIEQDPDRDAG